MKKITLLIITLLLCSAFKVRDGDSITGVIYRLAYIDAPELKQTCTVEGKTVAIGKHSREALDTLLNGRISTCVFEGYDKFKKRPIVDCGFNLGMVARGWAVCYDKFMKKGSPQLENCHAAQAQAKANKLGLWQCQDFEEPEKYRKRIKNAEGN